MDKTMEDPPTSAVLLDHCHFSQVIFNSVEKFYVPGGDITCCYTLTQHFVPRRKDWIGIFRVGWKTTREYYTFMWVPVPVELPKESSKQQEVKFKAYYLPKDDEYYQFCYVDQDGVIRGASIPFQFRPENEEDILVVTPQVRKQGQMEEIEQHNKELYKENQALQDSCASLQKQNTELQAELQRKQEELETLQSINEKLEQKVQEQDCWKTKLLQLKEHSQKMSSEKDKMSIQVNQLQAQLSAQEKEMQKLIQGDQDKTELLEQMKKEKDQLFLSLSKQMEQQKQLEHTVEELKAKESRVTRKQEELTEPGNKNTTVEEQLVQEVARLKAKEAKQDQKSQQAPVGLGNKEPAEENFDLLRRLSDDRILCDSLQREKENLERENEHLKEENRRLVTYMGLDSNSLAYQVPPSHPGGAGQNAGLVFGNPYSGIQESSSAGLKCSTFKSDLVGNTCDHTQEQHLLTRNLRCPVCSKIFPAREKQIFEDHVLCHSL